jgi:thiosulfate dehydrogenase (quinone) large subunit
MRDVSGSLSRGQQVGLILLRTLVGWHFLYEGYFKLWRPAWSRDGTPLAAWSSAAYLHAANGPFAALFHRLADSPWIGRVDTTVAAALILVGLSLTLGLFAQAGCAGALALLALFYLSQIPTAGVPQPQTEGAYLFVNKNLIEAGAVLVLLCFRTGWIAGLDCLRHEPRSRVAPAQEAAS